MNGFADLFNMRENALADLDLVGLLVNLALVLILGQIVSWHYLRFAKVLSNKRKTARLFVFIAATTMMVITVVKTSLALSLGLVGALSIIRFRTPIKEPEELAYLFLAIATGIGIGADQRLATCMMALVILGYLTVRGLRSINETAPRIFAHVTAQLNGDGTEDAPAKTPEAALKALLEQVSRTSSRVDLRRVDTHEGVFNATLILDLATTEEIGALLTRVETALPGATVSVVEDGEID